MIRPWHTWMIFSLCVAVVVAAMGWISLTALRLDRAEAAARRQAVLEENVRLALWRMDSALAPVVGQESARPYFAYSAFYPAERAYTRMFAEYESGEVLVPSPLLDQASPYIRLHFQVWPDGRFSSPQVPTGNMRDLAETAYTTGEKIEAAANRLAELQSLLSRDALLVAISPPEPPAVRVAVSPEPRQQTREQGQQAAAQPRPRQRPRNFDLQQRAQRQVQQIEIQQHRLPRKGSSRQALLNTLEWQARAGNFGNQVQAVDNQGSSLGLGGDKLREGLAHPVWMGDVLLLARWVSLNGEDYLQGCWLDWPAIRAWLVNEIKDLLPAGRLEPARETPSGNEGRTLAALPVKLVPGEVPGYSDRPVSPIRISLLIAWVCALLAALAVAALLVGTMSLSERRAAFVSAVTHEMRTPLTTFRMYTEMLVKGMIPDEAKRRRYLDTLRVEADRLSHLVENVLAYARLQRGSGPARVEKVTLLELIDRVGNRLAERAEHAGMSLVVEAADSPQPVTASADPAAVEQILFNLVDNACKYAAPAPDRRIHLEVDQRGKYIRIRVRDHGPGISKSDLRRLFRPFGKSARRAADSAPGVGLGLALSRRAARSMGGDLRLDDRIRDGACFALTLPALCRPPAPRGQAGPG